LNPYYTSLIQEIDRQIEQKKYDRALEMIQAEQDLPYVPQDAADALEERRKDCIANFDPPHKDPDLESLIHGNVHQQEYAVTLMKSVNLRQYEQEVQYLLDSEVLTDEIKGELIEELMEQRIDHSFTMKKSGLDVTFVPDLIPSAEEDETLVQTNRIFEEWFGNDNPTFERFCKRLLEQERLENRPFDFTDVEPLSIAAAIVRLVAESFGQSEEYAAFLKIHQLQNIVEQPLLIERRGDNHEK
jgi:hypothetical protein